MGSRFEFTAQYRELDLDEERSGSDPQLGCDENCQSLPDREGDQYQLWLSHLMPLGGGHFLKPQLRYRREDRNGDATSRDAYALQLSYSYMTAGWIFVGNAVYGESDFERANPLYGKRQDAVKTALDATLLYNLPIEGGRWQAFGSVFWAEPIQISISTTMK